MKNVTSQKKAREELNKSLYQSLPMAVVAVLIAASSFIWVLYGDTRTSAQVIWYYCLCATLTFRTLVYIWYLFTQKQQNLQNLHYYVFVVSATLVAVLWGVNSLLMPSNINYQLVVILVITSISTTPVLTYVASYLISVLYIIISLVPLIIWIIIQCINGIKIYQSFIIPMIIYAFFVLYSGRKINSLLIKNINIRFENADLLTNLETTNANLTSEIQLRKQQQKREQELTQQLLTTARKAGMADVASSVLHNIGNVLNSLNVSISLLKEKLNQSKLLDSLTTVNQDFKKHQDDFCRYLTEDPKGKQFPEYLSLLEQVTRNEQSSISKELESLDTHIQHIKEIVAMQQTLVGVLGVIESTFIPDLIENVVAMIGFDSFYIVERHYELEEPVLIDKMKLTQILSYLLRNSKNSLTQSKQKEKKLILTLLKVPNDMIEIRISNNGTGIEPKNLAQTFCFTFPTNQKDHDLGLHASAILANEMGGTIKAESDGINKGTTFILKFPTKPGIKY